jgi:hypothetical protein
MSVYNDNQLEQGVIENFISEGEILQTAGEIFYSLNPDPSTYSSDSPSAGKGKKVSNIKTKKDKHNAPAYYIANFEDEGWIILSADRRTVSIMAYSEKGSFDPDIEDMPLGLSSWMNTMTKTVEYARETNINLNTLPKTNHENIQTYASGGENTDVSYDGDTHKITCPLNIRVQLTTETGWRQEEGYNGKMPLVCNGNMRAKGGCATVALAQIMKYHSYPSSYNTGDGYSPTGQTSYYNWSLMVPSAVTTQVQQLYVDIATDANATYSCTSTTTYTSDVLATLYRFGYSYNYAVYSTETCLFELLYGRPSLLYARDIAENVGHLWICDGYAILNDEYVLHMNWGWAPRYNGYYWESTWLSGAYNFNYDKCIAYNIKPR